MSEETQFKSVWDALEDNPVRRENSKLPLKLTDKSSSLNNRR